MVNYRHHCVYCNKIADYYFPTFFVVKYIIIVDFYFQHLLWSHPKQAIIRLPLLLFSIIAAIAEWGHNIIHCILYVPYLILSKIF